MDSTRPVHIGRQALYDAQGRVAAYELLFRDGPAASYATSRDSAATSRVIVEAFTAFGIEELVGDKLCFVNVTREFLTGTLPLPFPPGRVGLEITRDVAADDEVEAGVAALAEQGHRLAVEGARLLRYTHFVKLDMRADPQSVRDAVRRARRHPRIRLVAERVETDEQLERADRLGFQLFQGHALSRPHLVTTRALTPSRLARMRLLAELSAEDVQLDRAVDAIERDPALAVRILRGVNAAANGLKQPVSSIFQAVVLLGIPQVRQWATLMVVADFAGGDEAALTDAVVRARMCQTVAHRRGGDAQAAFTVGLLSAIGDLVGGPASALTEQLPLTDDVAAAVAHERGDLGGVLGDVRRYLAAVTTKDLGDDLLAALRWTNASLAEPEPATAGSPGAAPRG
ncbi:HDOD domain-containing protein [Dactylosporangium sp. AC04546]|uniref:EAL and HDOD domain-containing protein n=1 Tax=Dactylosporangium sp. AC04546 TaxID=2862460 RepID=UPI001EDF9874|nr:HDOD domain-containing protein [Dactylosporangium sp. AC04546]WVK87861.1 HDOD domain-containing protein [Dactylosporangium sp. AC04546]